MILCIDTATSVCSVSLCHGGKIISTRESDQERSHASMLTVFISELLEEKGINAADLEAVAVSKGPGSYTGLRIGVSVAKGISYGTSVPLVGINTLESMYYGITEKVKVNKKNRPVLYCPMIDARRMEVYFSLFDSEGNVIIPTGAKVITGNSFESYLSQSQILFFGDGALKCRDVINSPNALFDESFRLSSAYMCSPATEAVKTKRFENVAYFEPFYLKEFIATIPKNNLT